MTSRTLSLDQVELNPSRIRTIRGTPISARIAPLHVPQGTTRCTAATNTLSPHYYLQNILLLWKILLFLRALMKVWDVLHKIYDKKGQKFAKVRLNLFDIFDLTGAAAPMWGHATSIQRMESNHRRMEKHPFFFLRNLERF